MTTSLNHKYDLIEYYSDSVHKDILKYVLKTDLSNLYVDFTGIGHYFNKSKSTIKLFLGSYFVPKQCPQGPQKLSSLKSFKIQNPHR